MECNNQEDFDMLEQATPSMLISTKCRSTLKSNGPASYYWGVRIEHGGAIAALPVLRQMTEKEADASELIEVPTRTIAEMLAIYRERTGVSAMYEPAYQILANALALYLHTLEPTVAATRDIIVTGQVIGRVDEQSILSYRWCQELFQAFPNTGTTCNAVWLTRELTGNPVSLKRRTDVTQEDLDQYRVIPAYQEPQILSCIQPHNVEWRQADGKNQYVLITTQDSDSRISQITYRSPTFPSYARLDGLASHWLTVYQMRKHFRLEEQE